ncbi:MAG TPA: AAA family ATPase [Thermodesulfobacteriaceae bacterium]|nr:AAA family ATPase [Thermodesulfobacteriaceae bacterium]
MKKRFHLNSLDEKSEDPADFPSHKELERELSDYLSKKYGGKIRVVSQMVFPRQIDPDGSRKDGGDSREQEAEIRFELKPEELEEYLNGYVVKQDRAKAVLATKVCTHFNKISYLKNRGKDASPLGNIKNNIILIGPTGVGKTYLIKLIAARLGVPFVKGDATKFSETGYVGGDVEDLIRDLVQEADGDIEKARHGIVYIDEIDKIASSRNITGLDVSRAGVQRALLKPLEETEVDLKVPHDPISQLEAIERYRKTGKREKQTINTRNILFIVSGAFGDLKEIIRRRLTRQGIGFGADIDVMEEQEWLQYIKPQDLIEFGFESEFVGRFPVIAVLEDLTADDLFEILRNPNSTVIISKKQDFRAYGIDLKFEEDAMRLLAEQAYQEHTGARALVSVVERALLPFEMKLPSTDIKSIVLTRAMVEDPEGELEMLLENPDEPDRLRRYEALRAWEVDSLEKRLEDEGVPGWEDSGMKLTPERKQLLARMAVQEDLNLKDAAEVVLFWIEQIKSYEASFFNRSGLRINIQDDAVDKLLENCLSDPTDIYAQCERLSSILEYGLSIIKEKTGRDRFDISVDAVENPELFINGLIRGCYRPDVSESSS